MAEPARKRDAEAQRVEEERRAKLKEAPPPGKDRLLEFGIGLIGGIFGVLGGITASLFGLIGAIEAAPGALTIIGLSVVGVALGALGIFGAIYMRKNANLGSSLMIISALGGLLAIFAFYIPAAALLFLAGVIGLARR